MADTAPKPFVFVLMPFENSFDDVYKLGIKPACEEGGAYCERVDEQIFDGSILARVYNQISKADIIVADMTGRNPNVFYEVGYAHALGKQVILATQRAEDIPFDLKHYPHIIYSGRIIDLKAQLQERVTWIINNVPQRLQSIAESVKLYLNRQLLCDGFSLKYPQPFDQMSLEVHNPTSRAFASQSIRIGIITTNTFDGDINCFLKAIPLPDNRIMFLLPRACPKRSSFKMKLPKGDTNPLSIAKSSLLWKHCQAVFTEKCENFAAPVQSAFP